MAHDPMHCVYFQVSYGFLLGMCVQDGSLGELVFKAYFEMQNLQTHLFTAKLCQV